VYPAGEINIGFLLFDLNIGNELEAIKHLMLLHFITSTLLLPNFGNKSTPFLALLPSRCHSFSM
jgi:hypothetical protein